MISIRCITCALLLAACLLAGRAMGQSPAGGDDTAAAVFSGGRMITLREVDEQAGPQIFTLLKQLYEIRKAALNSLIARVLLEEEAARRGIPVAELRRSIMSAPVEVAPEQVEKVLGDGPQPPSGLSEDEIRERIRLDLESQARVRNLQSALDGLRSRSGIEIKLVEPEPAPVSVTAVGPSRGPEEAPVTIVEFSDFQCPFCRRASATIDELLKSYDGKVRLVFRHFPLPNHPQAFRAAQAAVCAEAGGRFWEYHDRLFAAQNLSDEMLKGMASEAGLDAESFSACLDSARAREQVNKDLQEGRKIGIQGTPFFTINGRPVRGAVESSEFRRIIDRELANKKVGRASRVASTTNTNTRRNR